MPMKEIAETVSKKAFEPVNLTLKRFPFFQSGATSGIHMPKAVTYQEPTELRMEMCFAMGPQPNGIRRWESQPKRVSIRPRL